ncbi:Gfo/Idh/MocA family protein [Alienimonas californiensis]|uniref:Glucose--fructose oxidoreductase n=1 Tax=Alienimonas californiensis TaxID=2527989 RepID=A0A517PAG3_9PLAN|nr:Gfo/Idh/MocA family oxidoreductase [Alienimonas californiensis]QDT16368.1 Glucose--fructose oxidoreductase precursor [Alienimonas californiensis]
MSTRRQFLATSAALSAAASLSPRLFAAGAEGKKKLGYALVGLGRLSTGQLAPALQKTEHAKLAAVVSGTPSKREEWRKKYDLGEHVYSYEQFDRLSDDDAVDVIYIVLPNGLHAEYTIRGAETGKHVFCEKPMANTAEECRQMIAACEKGKVKLGIGYRCQFEPHHLRAMEVVRSGGVGELRGLGAGFGFKMPADADPDQKLHWRLNRKLAGGGPLMDVGIYALQFCRYMTGREPDSVTAQTTLTDPVKFRQVEETLGWTMTFPSVLGDDLPEPLRAQVTASCATTYNFSGFNQGEAFGPDGSVLLKPAYSYTGLEGFVKGEPMNLDTPDQFAIEIDAFSQSVKDNKPFKCPGEEGLRDLLAIEAIYKAAETGRRVDVAKV